MDEEIVKLTIHGKVKQYPKGITLKEISKEYEKDYNYPIIVAKRDGVTTELQKQVHDACDIEFCTARDNTGHRAYVRGLTMMMLKAMYKEAGRDKIECACVEYSLDSGYYCEVKGDITLSQRPEHSPGSHPGSPPRPTAAAT